ncbi:MAG: NADP-dependent oxidoreductase [Thermoleophilaceae bacterium]|nr:NADP-dependent oxidoreductase [Thermoleophilaceae bacterium]
MSEVNQRLLLRTRPTGRVSIDNFAVEETPVPEPGEGEAILRTLYLSLDPTNRIWMAQDSYLPKVAEGAVMRGMGIAQVVASNDDGFEVGDLAMGACGWQDYSSSNNAEIPWTPLPRGLPIPISTMLGALGVTGLTAYFGMTDVAKAQAGETVVVSAAAGAVGSIAGQIGKALGCRVVGLAGSADKCAWLTDELGFDAAVCYKDDDWREQLVAACPDGVDVNFENVGGEIMEQLLGMLNIGARVAVCGMISVYNEEVPPPGPRNLANLIFKRATMQGFLVLDYLDRSDEALAQMLPWLSEGKIRGEETIVEGPITDAPETLNMLFDGTNRGKLLLKVADPPLEVPTA